MLGKVRQADLIEAPVMAARRVRLNRLKRRYAAIIASIVAAASCSFLLCLKGEY